MLFQKVQSEISPLLSLWRFDKYHNDTLVLQWIGGVQPRGGEYDRSFLSLHPKEWFSLLTQQLLALMWIHSAAAVEERERSYGG